MFHDKSHIIQKKKKKVHTLKGLRTYVRFDLLTLYNAVQCPPHSISNSCPLPLLKLKRRLSPLKLHQIAKEMAAVSTSPMLNIDVDKLTYEIFSVLENKFLFGGYEYGHPDSDPKKSSKRNPASKVRILSIDGRGATDGILAAASLARLEASLRRKSANPDARIADFFDVVAGSGAGGILAALLFTRGRDGAPLLTADQALKFLVRNRRKIFPSSPSGIFGRFIRPAKAERLFRKTFGESTLKDTLKSVLIPCHDMSTNAPLLFSRADALEMDGYDFKMSDVCTATSAVRPVEIASVDRRTKLVAVSGEIAMNNPTAAAITHVLYNKLEFPLCKGVEGLLVVSLGNGESECGIGSPPAGLVRIAGEGAADLVQNIIIHFYLYIFFRIRKTLFGRKKKYCPNCPPTPRTHSQAL